MSTTPATPLVRANAAIEPKVESHDGGAIGVVHAFLLDKASGRTDFAVLSLGGFMGMGKSFYPVPFAMLHYDGIRDVYVVTVDKQMLEGGPSWSNNPPTFDAAYADRVARYYGPARA